MALEISRPISTVTAVPPITHPAISPDWCHHCCCCRGGVPRRNAINKARGPRNTPSYMLRSATKRLTADLGHYPISPTSPQCTTP
ncbi:hypothetical protein BC834DRAFT_95657 [Gloeopeniophorella convolvens]|nr:hypothetical protein BC834DRAFT_95657 [Gloeopeniophorella convolvens]